jgi:hypothetical protein
MPGAGWPTNLWPLAPEGRRAYMHPTFLDIVKTLRLVPGFGAGAEGPCFMETRWRISPS